MKRANLNDLMTQLPRPNGDRFVVGFENGSMQILVYAPRGTDPQKPHVKDEVYFVVSGQGLFVLGEERTKFGPGDALFVPAHAVHRFENFSDDLVVWVIFYGPDGGEGSNSLTAKTGAP
jgi:mannose-6-phosphate isomerase-like protein (cupin superfamily)